MTKNPDFKKRVTRLYRYLSILASNGRLSSKFVEKITNESDTDSESRLSSPEYECALSSHFHVFFDVVENFESYRGLLPADVTHAKDGSERDGVSIKAFYSSMCRPDIARDLYRVYVMRSGIKTKEDVNDFEAEELHQALRVLTERSMR